MNRYARSAGSASRAVLLAVVLALPAGTASAQHVRFEMRADTLTVGVPGIVDVLVSGDVLRSQPVNALQLYVRAGETVRVDSVEVAGELTGWTIASFAGKVATANMGATSLTKEGAILRLWVTATREGDSTIELRDMVLNGGSPGPESAVVSAALAVRSKGSP